jgi:hypothetical protein
MSSPEQELINANLREQLEKLIQSHNNNMMDHSERLAAL